MKRITLLSKSLLAARLLIRSFLTRSFLAEPFLTRFLTAGINRGPCQSRLFLFLAAIFVVSAFGSLHAAFATPRSLAPDYSLSSATTATPSIAPSRGPSFAPGFPGKKGPLFADERHSFKPRLLLPPEGVLGVSGIPVRPDTVRIKLLAIRVDFPETGFINPKLWLERHLLFLSQYFYGSSGGLLQIETILTDSVFTMPKAMAHYGQDDDLGLRLVELAVDALAACDSVIDFTQYDEIFLIHAGQGQEADVLGNSTDQIWSASLGPAEFEFYLPDTTGHVGIATNDTLSDGTVKYIQQLVIAPEEESQDSWNFSPLGVYVHEFGHLLGLPDLYDTEGNTEGNVDSQGIGNWGLMGTGLWNWGGYFPAEPEAWTKAVLGWKAVRVVSNPGDCVLPYSEGANPAGEIALVPLGGREYFLVENRLQDPNGNSLFDFDDADSNRAFDPYVDSCGGAEFDYFLPGYGAGSGLLVWHIDEQQVEARMPYNKVNADKYHKGVDLEEADGIQDMDRTDYSPESYGTPFDSFREGNNSSFTPYTEPNTDGSYGGKSYVYIEDIGPSGQLMSFSVDFGRRTGPWPVVADFPFGANHPNVADLNGDGTPEIIACDQGGGLHVLNGDGTPYAPAFPLKSLGESVFSSPVVGDIDGDGLKELVVVAAKGTVFAWNGEDMTEVRDGDGNSSTDGVLVNLFDVGRTAVVLADHDGDGADDIIFGASVPDTTLFPGPWDIGDIWDDSTRMGASVSGTAAQSAVQDSLYPHYRIRVLPGSVEVLRILYPAPVGRAPVVTDLDGDGEADCLIPMGSGDGLGRLNVWGVAACEGDRCYCIRCQVEGLEVEVVEVVAGDLDKDSRVDIVAADVAGYVHALSMSATTGETGEPAWEVRELPGWPVQLADSAIAGLSLGEIDGDGRLEVLATCNGRAFAINYNGTLLPGWPPEFPTRPYGFGAAHGPLCADVSGDNFAEYVGTICDSRLLAIGRDGRTLKGWPIVAGSFYGTSPVLADVDDDGLTELVLVRDVGVNDSLQGEIDAIELGVPSSSDAAWWPSYRRDAAHSGVMPDSVALPVPPALRLVRKVYAMPNPVRGESAELHYELGEGIDRVRLEIYDLSGRLVHSASPAVFASSDNIYRLHLGAFAPAVYLFSIEAVAQDGTIEKAFSRMAVIR